MIVPVGLALGSNQGDRQAELDAGISFLRSLDFRNQVCPSAPFETAPVDCPPGSPPFLNAVAEIELDPEVMPPRDLLRRLQAFEWERGRLSVRDLNAPRPLDLDILYYGNLELSESGLTIPHPRAAERRFVLEPLAQIRPDLILPGQKQTVRELLRQFQNQGRPTHLSAMC
jgi:2-amino-4-hydroxy-6-hydroxymethyldihydropteridine diphosphokinase